LLETAKRQEESVFDLHHRQQQQMNSKPGTANSQKADVSNLNSQSNSRSNSPLPSGKKPSVINSSPISPSHHIANSVNLMDQEKALGYQELMQKVTTGFGNSKRVLDEWLFHQTLKRFHVS
jgi:hypothetical protein